MDPTEQRGLETRRDREDGIEVGACAVDIVERELGLTAHRATAGQRDCGMFRYSAEARGSARLQREAMRAILDANGFADGKIRNWS